MKGEKKDAISSSSGLISVKYPTLHRSQEWGMTRHYQRSIADTVNRASRNPYISSPRGNNRDTGIDERLCFFVGVRSGEEGFLLWGVESGEDWESEE